MRNKGLITQTSQSSNKLTNIESPCTSFQDSVQLTIINPKMRSATLILGLFFAATSAAIPLPRAPAVAGSSQRPLIPLLLTITCKKIVSNICLFACTNSIGTHPPWHIHCPRWRSNSRWRRDLERWPLPTGCRYVSPSNYNISFETDDRCIQPQQNDDQSLTLGVKRTLRMKMSRGTLTFIEEAQVCGVCTYIHRAMIAQAETHILGP